MRALSLIVLLLLAPACASFEASRGHDEVAKLVGERAGAGTGWEEGSPSAEQLAGRVDALLDGGLTPDRVVQLALLNSPSLQETYEELGIAQADALQAGLLSNPEFDFSFGTPLSPGSIAEHEFGIVQSFVDLLMLPTKKRVADEQFAADTLRVAHEALAVTAEAKKTFVDVQVAEALLQSQTQLLATERAAAELAKRQHEAGNITDLEWAERTAAYEQARVALSQTQLGLLSQRERLNRLLGLWGPRTQWKVASPSAEPPDSAPELSHLESLAIRQRLDLQAAKKRTLLLHNAVELARTFRYFGRIDVGVHQHQDADGPRLFGPTLTLELPLFDQRQAVIARLESEQRQAERRLTALSVQVRSEVRETQARLLAAHQLVRHLKTRVLPLRAQVVDQSQLQYNGMQIGLYHLLEAKHAELESVRDYLEAKREYWAAAIELEQLVGGQLPPPRNASNP